MERKFLLATWHLDEFVPHADWQVDSLVTIKTRRLEEQEIIKIDVLEVVEQRYAGLWSSLPAFLSPDQFKPTGNTHA
jgi:hypothetical protein